jgi:hypothetical protein
LRAKSSLVAVLLLSMALFPALFMARPVAAYAPSPGDYFNYHEVEHLLNGTGSYAGYTEQTVVNGDERINAVAGGVASANYSYMYNWSNSTGGTQAGVQSGSFTFSPTTFLYVNGTDDQQGYVNPTVWFYINSSAPVGSTVLLLNTGATVMSRDYSYYLPSFGRNVTTIFVQGISTYYGSPDDNAYGLNNAKYTWNAYFDPTTGYIIGYNYVEYDTNTSGYGFAWTDNLYVTATSYPLTTVGGVLTTSATQTSSVSSSVPGAGSAPYVGYIAGLAIVVVVIAILVYSVSRRRRPELPRHSQEPPSSPPPDIDLTPRQPPVQQIVVKEVAMKTCTHCGSLIPTTAQTCPRCGAPNE